ncbi:MAG: Asp-tRNA(Asn)/Glu-tRNA(Gln) amidotransferase subunit GatC [Cellvibrionales bacterium]|nr:Asp-tRNA(Asn)/Glu-tRNA(Gln) amidotransferase subunit GatC [Cellvibrionales bacterium]
MALQPDEIARLARLAHIQVTAEECGTLTERLDAVLDMVRQLQACDTAGVEPLAHPLDAVQELRPDAVADAESPETLMRNAPAAAAGLFLVPRVLD